MAQAANQKGLAHLKCKQRVLPVKRTNDRQCYIYIISSTLRSDKGQSLNSMKNITGGFSEARPSCFRNPSINFWGLPEAPGRVFTGLLSNLFFKGLWIFFGELTGFFFLFRFFSFTAAGFSWCNGFFGTKGVLTWYIQQNMSGEYRVIFFFLLNMTAARVHAHTHRHWPLTKIVLEAVTGWKRRL